MTGEAGIGKSSLLGAAQQLLADQGALVLEANCRSGLPSYQPFLEVVRSALKHLFNNGGNPQGEQLLEVLGGRGTGSSSGDLRGDRISLFDALAELLISASASKPVALVVHDLHVADPATRQLVLYLARVLTSAPLLPSSQFRGVIIAAVADAAALDTEAGWDESVNVQQLALDGLDPGGVKAFLSSERVVQRVLKATQGRPQALNAMIANDHLDALSPLRDVGSSEREMLEVLAVFGRPLGPETLQLLTRTPHSELARAISTCIDRGVVEKLVVEGELRIAFARVGEQQAVYEAIDVDQKRALHAKVGRYLRNTGRQSDLEAAAHHLLLGRCNSAVQTAMSAAQRLEISFCHERAADLYERAYLQTERSARQQEIVERLCALHEAAGQLGRALQWAERLREREGGTANNVDLELRIARLHLRRGDFSESLRALRLLDTTGCSASFRAQVLAYTAEAHYLAGEVEDALGAAAAGFELFSSLPHPDDASERRAWLTLQNTAGLIHLERDEWSEARQLFVSNLEIAQAANLATEEVRATIQLGLTNLRCGDFVEAERYYRHAQKRAEAVGELRYLGACLQHLGVLAERRRDYGRALACYQEAVNVWKRVGHRCYLAWVGLDLAKLYLDLGDVAKASAMVALADKLADAEPPLATRISLELLRGRLAQQHHRYAEADDRFRRAEQLAADARHEERKQRAMLYRVELLLDRGADADAESLLRRRGLPRKGSARLRALLLRASLHDRSGDLNSARMDLGEALELSETLHDREANWEALLQLSSIARRRGCAVEADRLLADAVDVERSVRRGVPEELKKFLVETPRRVALRAALDSRDSSTPPERSTPRPKRATPRRRRHHPEIVGEHPRMHQVLQQVDKVGPTDALVLVRGESGTGKELVADAIHHASPRAKKPLIKVNCGALVETLLLSELFGHERGAFTGATQRRAGRFELADGGTIFLDEIGDISPKTQVALLRVLQDRSFERVGGTARIEVDVRIICATNRNLEQMVADGLFREDLYYRLKGVQIDLPALRERPADVDLLTEHFLGNIATERGSAQQTLDETAQHLLRQHAWPGNVRELENVLRSVSLFVDGQVLTAEHFAEYVELHQSHGSAVLPDLGRDAYSELRANSYSLRDLKKRVESECIRRALADSEGNITRAAELLGMKRPRLSQLVKEHGLNGTGGVR